MNSQNGKKSISGQNKTKSHDIDMNCLQNCTVWLLSIKTISESSQSKLKTTESTGKNYFLNKLMLNYSELLSGFNFFKYSQSFLDFFFVKSMEQNKDKIEFLNITPAFPIKYFNLLTSDFQSEEEFFKFFADFDISKRSLFNNLTEETSKNNYELNINGKFHNFNFFDENLIIEINGSVLINLIRTRLLELKDTNKDNNEFYCKLMYNSNIKIGMFVKVENIALALSNIYDGKISILKFLIEFNLPICVINGTMINNESRRKISNNNECNFNIIEELINDNKNKKIKAQIINRNNYSFNNSQVYSKKIGSNNKFNTSSYYNDPYANIRPDNKIDIINSTNQNSIVKDQPIKITSSHKNSAQYENNTNSNYVYRQKTSIVSANNINRIQNDLNVSNSQSSLNSGSKVIKNNTYNNPNNFNNLQQQMIFNNQIYGSPHPFDYSQVSQNQYKNFYLNYNYYMSNQSNNQKLLVYNNFQQFMTNTTPLIDEAEEGSINLKQYFSFFTNAAVFGIECFYKLPL